MFITHVHPIFASCMHCLMALLCGPHPVCEHYLAETGGDTRMKHFWRHLSKAHSCRSAAAAFSVHSMLLEHEVSFSTAESLATKSSAASTPAYSTIKAPLGMGAAALTPQPRFSVRKRSILGSCSMLKGLHQVRKTSTNKGSHHYVELTSHYVEHRYRTPPFSISSSHQR